MFSKLNSIRLAALVGIFVIFNLVSCTQNKDNDEAAIDPENAESVTIQEDNFTESDEDLLTVDYKEFYEELSPHGEWIEVTPDKIGVDLNTGSASGSVKHRRMSLSTFLGVSEAYAEDISTGAFFVWKPAADLSVGITAGDQPDLDGDIKVEPTYVPYTNGQWINTDQGWYFKAATPQEEIVHHYGRWTHSPEVGWVWVPGRVWSPAWVDWREDDSNVGWSPLPPGVYVVDDRVMDPRIYDDKYDDRYVVVEKKYFVEPEIYKYHVVRNKKKVIIHEMRKVDGVMVVNHQVINKGPEVTVIEKVLGEPVPMYDINKVSVLSDAGDNGTVINTYYPGFKEFKVVQTIESPVRKPVDFVTFEKVKNNSKTPPGLEKKSDEEKEKSEKEDEKESKNDDKGNKNKSNNNGNSKKFDDDKGNKNKGNEKVNKNNGNKNNGKGNEKRGNNNVKKNDHKNKGNGNSNKSHNNGNKNRGSNNNKHRGKK